MSVIPSPSNNAQVWLPSIPDGTNSYNLSINQPEGSHFLLTMWGASGISYAGTTDVNSESTNLSR